MYFGFLKNIDRFSLSWMCTASPWIGVSLCFPHYFTLSYVHGWRTYFLFDLNLSFAIVFWCSLVSELKKKVDYRPLFTLPDSAFKISILSSFNYLSFQADETSYFFLSWKFLQTSDQQRHSTYSLFQFYGILFEKGEPVLHIALSIKLCWRYVYWHNDIFVFVWWSTTHS